MKKKKIFKNIKMFSQLLLISCEQIFKFTIWFIFNGALRIVAGYYNLYGNITIKLYLFIIMVGSLYWASKGMFYYFKQYFLKK